MVSHDRVCCQQNVDKGDYIAFMVHVQATGKSVNFQRTTSQDFCVLCTV